MIAPWVVYADKANNFHISGFTLQNSGQGWIGFPHLLAGVYLYYSNNCTITGTTLLNNWEGVYLWNSYYNNISHNTIISSDANGITLLFYSGGNWISYNTIESNKGGIGLYDDRDQRGNTVSNNTARLNEYGIDVWSHNNVVTLNKITSNTQYGVWLWAEDNVVRGNHIKNNGKGIVFNTTYYGPTDNRIYWNNVINNTVQTDSNGLFNSWTGRWNETGNHWSDYDGNDSDRDGRGDTPYVIDENNVDYYPLMNPWLPGDVNNDGKVEGRDIAIIAKAYGSYYPDHPRWNPRADLNEDAIVDDLDIDIAAANYGKTWQTYWGE